MLYRVKILKTNREEGEELIFEINGNKYCAMGITPYSCQDGDEVEAELDFLSINETPWNTLFSENKLKTKKLEHREGWRYYAFGKIISIKPTIVDVGDFCLDIGELTNDVRVIGEYVWFNVDRLDIYINEKNNV